MTHTQKDWHPAEIICALRKRGTTLAALSRESGLSSSTLANTLSRPWPKCALCGCLWGIISGQAA